VKLTKQETTEKAFCLDNFLDNPECINNTDFLLKVSAVLMQFNKDSPAYKLGLRLFEYAKKIFT
jgi:hypothetical protein